MCFVDETPKQRERLCFQSQKGSEEWSTFVSPQYSNGLCELLTRLGAKTLKLHLRFS